MNQFNDFNVPAPPKFATFKECDTYADMLPYATGVQQKAFLVRNDETNGGAQTAYIYDGQDELTSLARIISTTGGEGIDTNFATTDLTLTGDRVHQVNNHSLEINNAGLFKLEVSPAYFQTTFHDNVLWTAILQNNVGVTLLSGTLAERALISFYIRATFAASSEADCKAYLASYFPVTGDLLIPEPPYDPEKTVVFLASQVADKGEAKIYGRTIILDTDFLKVNTARMATTAGRVLTDLLGDGILTMQPLSGGWGLLGNLINEAVNFIGSTTAQDVVFKYNNVEKLRLSGNQNTFTGYTYIGGPSVTTGEAQFFGRITSYGNINSTGTLHAFGAILSTVLEEACTLLALNSTTKGFLPPRMTTAQKTAIAAPAEGLEVYDLDLHQKSYFNGTVWINY